MERNDTPSTLYTPRGFENWNRAHRGAYRKGQRAAIDGLPPSACPYVDKRKSSGRLSWSRSFIRAWQDGHADQSAAMNED